jgi:hypothetical protein
MKPFDKGANLMIEVLASLDQPINIILLICLGKQLHKWFVKKSNDPIL